MFEKEATSSVPSKSRLALIFPVVPLFHASVDTPLLQEPALAFVPDVPIVIVALFPPAFPSEFSALL